MTSLSRTFDPAVWSAVPPAFWPLCFFAFGCCVGSFLNVCIHRLPRGMSVVSPPSHCPHCRYRIPWFLNIPLVTWLFLRGRCAHCRAPISARYFVVELFTGLLFLAAWLVAGQQSPWLALVYCLVLAGLTAATFIDFEHYIIPDEITIGGMVAGVLCSFAVPAVQGQAAPISGLIQSFLGLGVGMGVVYGVVRVGKILFGRQQIDLPPGTRVVFTENAIVLPHEQILFEDVFYRDTDAVTFQASSLELIDRCYQSVPVRLLPNRLHIGDEQLDPESIPQMEAVVDGLVLPREAMGLGDVKFMGAIGAFLGWQAALFSLMASSILGAIVGLALIALRRQDWSSKLPYGPYIAVAAGLWLFAGRQLVNWWLGR